MIEYEKILNTRFIHTAGEAVLNTLFPRRCPVCDEAVKPFGRLICKDCDGALVVSGDPRCFRCGKPLSESEREAEYCKDCGEKEHFFDRGYSLYEYGSAAKSLYRFKYAGRREYAACYADDFVRLYEKGRDGLLVRRKGGITAEGRKIEALVPVPLHQARLKKRGYNQSEEYARVLSALTGVPVAGGLVRRVKNTLPMKDLDRESRRNNLKNAFIMGKNDVSLRSIAVVDDIYTTGSTADALALLFKRHGVRFVYVFTIAVGTQ